MGIKHLFHAMFRNNVNPFSRRRTDGGGEGGGWARGFAASLPQILGNKRKFGQSQFLKTFPCFYIIWKLA